MNLLSSIKFCILFLFFTSYLTANTTPQSDSSDFRQYEMKYRNEDAWYVFMKSDAELTDKASFLRKSFMANNINPEDIRLTTTVHHKLKINTKNGVDRYAFIYLAKEIESYIRSLEVKTIKPDGSVILMDSAHIFNRSGESNDRDNPEMNQMRCAIPGVEAGDIIEISYIMTYRNINIHQQFANVLMHSDLPVAESAFSVRVPAPYTIFYKCYNNFPEPEVVASDTSIYCVFSLHDLKAVKSYQYSCLQCSLPYFYFSLEYDKSTITNTWKQLYNRDFNMLTSPLTFIRQKASYYEKWKRNLLKNCRDSSKYYHLNVLLAYIRDNMEVKNLEENEQFRSAGYFISKGYIDVNNTRRLYRQILEDLHIDYWAGFGRNKWTGPIDYHFIRKNEISDVFFLYKDENGKMVYLYPHDEYYKYEINELPTSLYNTDAIIAKPATNRPSKMSGNPVFYGYVSNDSVIVKQVALSAGNNNINYLKQLITYHTDFSLSNDTFKSVFTISGGVSTKYRQLYSFLDKNKELDQLYRSLFDYKDMQSAFRVDTVIQRDFMHSQPFRYKAVTLGKVKKGITHINDSIISIALNDVIFHDQVDTENDSIEMDYLLDYPYTDIMQLFISFEEPFEILNLQDLNKTVVNQAGEYDCSISTISGNTVCIISRYCINKDYITGNEYPSLVAINDLINEVKNSRVMIKMQQSYPVAQYE